MSSFANKPQSEKLIVGAGAAGLAAAWNIAAARPHGDCRIRVLEATDRIGGRAFCEEIDGFHVFAGASVIHESFLSTRDLARELGVKLHRSPGQKGAQSYAGGRFWGLYAGGSLKQSLTTLRTMLFSPQHTLGGVWEFMRLHALLRKRAGDLDFEDHSRMLDLDKGESLAEFARANSLGRYLRQAGELDINCFTAGRSEKVGAAYAMALLWLWTFNPASRSYLPRQGIFALVKALADACAGYIRVSTPVERIVLDRGRASGVVTAGGEEIEADAVICATTASTAARIVPDLPEDVRAVLERVRYSSCCYVAFGLEENILADGAHAALFPPGSPTILTMVSNLAATAPEIAPAGKTLVHALVTGEKARVLFDLDDDKIVRQVLTHMRRFFPSMPERPLFARVYRWPEAICLSPGGMLRDVHDMRMKLRRSIQGLYLAGDYTFLPSLNGAIKSGIEAAQASLSHVDPASRGETWFSR